MVLTPMEIWHLGRRQKSRGDTTLSWAKTDPYTPYLLTVLHGAFRASTHPTS